MKNIALVVMVALFPSLSMAKSMVCEYTPFCFKCTGNQQRYQTVTVEKKGEGSSPEFLKSLEYASRSNTKLTIRVKLEDEPIALSTSDEDKPVFARFRGSEIDVNFGFYSMTSEGNLELQHQGREDSVKCSVTWF